jgi:hypothetical protein
MIISPSAISPYKASTFQSGGAPFVGLLTYPIQQRLIQKGLKNAGVNEVRRSSDNALQDIGLMQMV